MPKLDYVVEQDNILIEKCGEVLESNPDIHIPNLDKDSDHPYTPVELMHYCLCTNCSPESLIE
ncbi:MAG: hypothetical protein OQK82_06525 [Candidatus Pacearchaeota archaeon]|nr:hypothetical protein [Candidatus Pacearchaeota archaeon]